MIAATFPMRSRYVSGFLSTWHFHCALKMLVIVKLRSGLQIRVDRFDSGTRLQYLAVPSGAALNTSLNIHRSPPVRSWVNLATVRAIPASKRDMG